MRFRSLAFRIGSSRPPRGADRLSGRRPAQARSLARVRVYAFGLLVACLPFLAASPAAAAPDWDANVARAARYAETRGGVESFAVVDQAGRMRAWGGRRVYPSASVLKAMLLVAYLERPSVRDRALTAEERGCSSR